MRLILGCLLASAVALTAIAQPVTTLPPPIPDQPTDDLTAAYQVCVSHQERVFPAPSIPTGKDYRYTGVWAEKCPNVEESFLSRERTKKAERDKADLEKINKVSK